MVQIRVPDITQTPQAYNRYHTPRHQQLCKYGFEPDYFNNSVGYTVYMNRKVGIPVFVFSLLAVITVGAVGTRLGNQLNLLYSFAIVYVLGSLLILYKTNEKQRLAVIVAAIGVVVYTSGIYSDHLCLMIESAPNSTFGVTYNVSANQIYYGERVDGQPFRCGISPNRPLVALGYVLTTVGIQGVAKEHS